MGTYSKLRHQSEMATPQEETSHDVRDERDERAEAKVTEKPSDPREVKRKSYDLYVDQINTLNTQTKIFFLVKGEQKNVTQMIREAIDEYIEKYQ